MKQRIPVSVLVLLAACGEDTLHTLPRTPIAKAEGLDFGETRIGVAVERSIEIRNAGEGPLEIGWPLVAGEQAASFSVRDAPDLVPPGAAASIELAFTPLTPGEHVAWLVVETNASPPRLEVRLSGRAPHLLCGNAIPDPGEACDDGVANGTYGRCNAACTGPSPRCGDAAVDTDFGESCDDGTNDGSYGRCLPGCDGPGPRCGDGAVNGPESCDDGDGNGSYGHCRDACDGLGPRCGDAAVDTDFGESCDDGTNDGSYGRCLPGCGGLGPRCGDGKVNGPESCDDGAANGSYGHCRAGCDGPGPFCGDGAVNGGEACDPSAGPTYCCTDSCARASPCDVTLYLTADDAFEVYLDGARLGGEASWGQVFRYDLPIGGGNHVLAIAAWDTQTWRHGVKALLQINGETVHQTGEPSWKTTRDDPGAGWEQRGYDDSGWTSAAPCSDQGAWLHTHEPPLESAPWVWNTPDCITEDQILRTWYRLHFVSD